MSPAQYAKLILQAHWDGSIPVNPISIAAQIGVYVFPLEEGCSTSGLYRVENGVPKIYVNQHESPLRRRFTIAHELGHHVLGHLSEAIASGGNAELPRDGNVTYSLAFYDQKEVDANKFAAELLMPESAVAYFVDKTTKNLSELARTFNVSDTAMSYRLSNLGYF